MLLQRLSRGLFHQYRQTARLSSLCHFSSAAAEQTDFQRLWTEEDKRLFLNDLLVVNDFITTDEEQQLFTEVEPHLKRMKYEFDHWDGVIVGYREIERKNWLPENRKIIEKVQNYALKDSKILSHIHVLDLAEDGEILPHVDNVRFCGTTIAGLSLLSDAIMRFSRAKEDTNETGGDTKQTAAKTNSGEETSEPYVDVYLKRRSLYIIRDKVRYDYTHEVLRKELSIFKSQPILKTRRISVICRNEP